MAIKPTIFKARIALSDLERNYYDTLNLTIAQHPSEASERMMARILAVALNAQERLTFSKGLSSVEEPDVWLHSLDEQIELWIDVGEPAFDRVKKACNTSKQVKVYSFNSKSDVWWQQNASKFARLKASVFQFDWPIIKDFTGLLERTMDMSITVTGDSAYITTKLGECEVTWSVLQEATTQS